MADMRVTDLPAGTTPLDGTELAEVVQGGISTQVTTQDIADLSPGGLAELLHVRDEKTSGTSGGSSSAATWHTRTLNTIKTNEITGASLASNLLTLPAGTYEIHASAPSYACGRHRLRLWNATTSAVILLGPNSYSAGTGGSSASLRGRFTLAGATDVRLDHHIELAVATHGLGVESSVGVEVYADVEIRKVD